MSGSAKISLPTPIRASSSAENPPIHPQPAIAIVFSWSASTSYTDMIPRFRLNCSFIITSFPPLSFPHLLSNNHIVFDAFPLMYPSILKDSIHTVIVFDPRYTLGSLIISKGNLKIRCM